MVCLGNICRSPLAEGILKEKLPNNLFTVDSAGTAGFHIGRPPDPRSIDVAAQNGISIGHLKAREFTPADFRKFDKIYVMDRQNLSQVQSLAATPEEENKVTLIMESEEIPDPYYGGVEDFKTVFDLLNTACNARRDQLLKNLS